MSPRSLTRAEARRRSALVAVERYDVAVDLTDLPTGPAVRCVSTISFTCIEPGAETFVDCAADVAGATLNGQPLGPAENGRLRLPDLAARNVLRVESVTRDTAEGDGAHKAVDPADGEVYLWMTFTPDEARTVWACFDQPDLKAPHAFTVTAPAEWTVLSNSGDPVVEDLGPARRWVFPDTPPLSTYNTVVNAGPFHEIRREAAGHDLGLLARRSLAGVLERDADELFTLTEQGLRFFTEAFGMPFPQRKYDQVFVPEFGGAMENFGCITWSDWFLRRGTPTRAEWDIFSRYLLHELAHMWFGNIVTMRWWDDIWLNEAFAEFAANWAAVRATTYTDAWAVHLAGGKLTAYLVDQGPSTHPIRQPVADVAEAMATFDAITYPKGASVLRQLMAYVGEPEFRAGMAAYFAEHAWGNTTLQDLMTALAAASGRDLDIWRAGWLETAGPDRLALVDDGEGLVLVAFGPDGHQPRPHVLNVAAYRGRAGTLERTGCTLVEVSGERTPVDLPAQADLYLVNDDDLTFAAVRPDARTRDLLFRAAADLPTAIARGVAVATVWDMLLDGEATAAEVVGCLVRVFEAETSASMIEPYLTRAADTADLWAPDAVRSELAAAVAAGCRRLAADPAHRQVALRALARTASSADDHAWLRDQAGEDVDLRWRAAARAAELGADTDAEVEALLAADPDPDAWVSALVVRAARPDAGAKVEVWETLTEERSVPIGSVASVAAAFWRPGQDAVLAPFVERYLDLLPRLDGAGMLVGSVFAGRLFPLFAVDEDLLARAEAAAAGAAPIVRQPVLERADLVRRMLRSRR